MTTNFDNILCLQNANFCFEFLNNLHFEDVKCCHNISIKFIGVKKFPMQCQFSKHVFLFQQAFEVSEHSLLPACNKLYSQFYHKCILIGANMLVDICKLLFISLHQPVTKNQTPNFFVFVVVARGRSQTTLTSFWLFLTTYPPSVDSFYLILIFLNYPPLLVNVFRTKNKNMALC